MAVFYSEPVFGAKPIFGSMSIFNSEPVLGAKTNFISEPVFGVKPVFYPEPVFGAKPVFDSEPVFCAKPVLLIAGPLRLHPSEAAPLVTTKAERKRASRDKEQWICFTFACPTSVVTSCI